MAAGGGHHPCSQMFDRRRHEESHISAKTLLQAVRAGVSHSNTQDVFEVIKARTDWGGEMLSKGSLNPPYAKPCGQSAALEGLKSITFPELELGKVHYGRVLYGQFSVKAFKYSAVHTVLEDEFGRGVRLSVYDAVLPWASPEEIEGLYPVGMKVAIKEPYFKWASDGHALVRVDDPADVVRIPKRKENIVKLKSLREELREEAPTSEFLQVARSEGNKLFRKEDWIGAIFQYSLCIDAAVDGGESLDLTSEDSKDMIKLAYSNRAEARLRLSEFEMALSDAEKALQLDPTHLKSLSRLGRAAMRVGQYQKACEAFVAVLERCPDEPSTRENLRLCKERLVQARAGNPDKESTYSSLKNRRVDYVGPVDIRRVDYGDGRRGLFAKESIKAHTVFLVSTAMALVAKQPGGYRAIYDELASNVDSSNGSSGTHSLAHDHDALVQLLERAATSKRSKAQLCSLATAGKEEMAVPPMELFKPGSQWAPSSTSTTKVDANLIKEVVRLNSISSGHSESEFSSTCEKDMKDEPVTAGLWVLPSFMNHSCVPNCVHMSAGDVKYVRTKRDIEPGEELTISYIKILFAGVEARAQELSFQCKCERCCLEKQLDAEFSQVSTRVGVLVPRSREEFADGHGRFEATREFDQLSDEGADLVRSLNITAPKLNTHRKGGVGQAS